jgi:Domain of unknown function (DUF4214)
MPTTARTYQSAGLFTCYEPLNDSPLLAGSFIKSGLSNSSQMIFEGSIDSVGSVRFDWLGDFSATSASSIRTMADFFSSDLPVSGLRGYAKDVLWREDEISPAIAASSVGFSEQLSDLREQYAGDDIFFGSLAVGARDDGMGGHGGNDTFYGYGDAGLRHDIIDGGDGIDVSVYRGTRREYTITRSNNLWDFETRTPTKSGYLIVDSITDRDGEDDLIAVERLRFSDASLALDTTGIAGKAYRIYKAAFDRTPDGGGLGYWIAQMDKGMDVVEVAARFIDSPEFRALYGQNPSITEFLTKVYTNVLDRAPDTAGLAWWINEMKTNPSKSWQKVLADFSESPENQTVVASLIGNGITYTPWLA